MESPATQSLSAVFVLSVSSDIGEQLALHFLDLGLRVAGTYRRELPASLRRREDFVGLRCDVSTRESGAQIATFLRAEDFHWDLFVSCVGQLAPVGPFFGCDFDQWSDSVATSSVAQLRALHAAYPMRRASGVSHVVFFAGGGTNNPFPSYSAYCVGKIALIKMCELLDDENPDLNVFIVGTGWVRTKIHEQTLEAGELAGANLQKTRSFIDQGIQGTSHADIAAMIRWGVEQGRPVAGGRNFSVVHDAWNDDGPGLAAALSSDTDKFKLRRHGNSKN